MRRNKARTRTLAAALGLIGVLALAGCTAPGSLPGATSTGSPGASTPQTAEGILARVRQANLRDATFTMQEQLTGKGIQLGAAGGGKLTTQPFREDISVSGGVTGTQGATELVTDGHTIYARPAGATRWTVLPASGLIGNALASTSLNDVANLPDAQLVGSEKVNGADTWHLKGARTQTVLGNSVALTEDMWVNKSTYQPVKIVDVATTPQGVVTSTFVFTAWNTGVTITAPPSGAVTTPPVPLTPVP